MNNWIAILILIVGTIISTYLLPWYCITIVGIVLGYLWNIKGLNAFGIGVLIPAITWITIVLLQSNNHDISIANILGDLFGGISSVIVYAMTGLTIGIVSGLAVLSGNILNKISSK